MLIEYLQLKKDVRFFTSMAGLMNKCSVLNLEMFERQIKVGSYKCHRCSEFHRKTWAKTY